MTIKKETEFMHSVILYCLRCHAEGDLTALHDMGFGGEEMRGIMSLTAAEQVKLAAHGTRLLSVTLDRDVFWQAVKNIDQDSDRETEINRLITHDAPLPMMYATTGMGSKSYSLKRRQFGMLKSPVGRPPVPSDETANSVFDKLAEIAERSDYQGPKMFLDLFEELDRKVPLRVIWNLFHRWEREGRIKVTRGPIRDQRYAGSDAITGVDR